MENPTTQLEPAPTMTAAEALAAYIELQAKAENLIWEHPQLRAILNDMRTGIHLKAWARLNQESLFPAVEAEAARYLKP